MVSLSEAARTAVAQSNGDLEVAFTFLQIVLPAFLGESNDRLVKLGRRIIYLVKAHNDETSSADLEACLNGVMEESKILLNPDGFVVPRVPFGKTGLAMPIVTLGRFSHSFQ